MSTDEPARHGWRQPVQRIPWLRGLIAERDALRLQVARMEVRRRRLQRKRLSLQRVLEEKDTQLGLLRQRGSGEPGRQDLRFLFIVTYGRTGSTLLRGILSSAPGVLLRGENGGAVYHLYRFHQVCTKEQQERRGTLAPRHPQFGIEGYPSGVALADIRALVLDTLIRPEPESRVVGFKEIRWQYPDVEEYVAFLRGVFPGARFVINSRDLEEVARSKWWAANPDARTQLEETDRRLRSLAASLGPDAFHVHYNDYVADPGSLRGLFEWAGVEYDEQRVREAMSVTYSY
jgi:hypothetical protein